MVRTRGHHLVDIGAERQGLVAAVAHPVDFTRDERRVLHLDATAFGWGFQPERPIRLALQHAGEQAHQFLAVDRAAAIQPGAVTLDQEREGTAFDRYAARARLTASSRRKRLDKPRGDRRRARPTTDRVGKRRWRAGLVHVSVSIPADLSSAGPI